MTGVPIQIADVQVELLPDRAVFLPGAASLVVTDVHWGKAATLRAASIAVPPGTTSTDLERLTRVIRRTGASHLVVIGDLIHASAWRAPRTQDAIRRWRASHPGLEITLVRGNHDARSGPIPDALGIRSCEEPLAHGGLVLRHRPVADGPGYTLAGHVHPSFTLHGPGRQRERLPCFLFGPRSALLPAFGSFTGMAPITPSPADRLFVVAGGDVVEIPSHDE